LLCRFENHEARDVFVLQHEVYLRPREKKKKSSHGKKGGGKNYQYRGAHEANGGTLGDKLGLKVASERHLTRLGEGYHLINCQKLQGKGSTESPTKKETKIRDEKEVSSMVRPERLREANFIVYPAKLDHYGGKVNSIV